MSSESAFAYDGPLSTYREWDALLYGIAAGIVAATTPIPRDAGREPSKAIAGVFVGYALARKYIGGG